MELRNNRVINEYTKISKKMLKMNFPTLFYSEIDKAIEFSINKRVNNPNININNNYKNQDYSSTLLEISDYIKRKQPIVTSYGCIFMKHDTVPNPIYKLIEKFVNARIAYKNEMFKYPKGSDMYKRYDLLQLLAKIDSNAVYGVLGASSSLIYNIYVAASITNNGRAAISTSIMFFESFFSNNVKFLSLNEVISFINNVTSEKRIYDDTMFLDSDITLEETFYKLMTTSGFEWIPTEEEMQIVYDLLHSLSQQDLNRLYYKNNLYSFCDNKAIGKLLLYILETLQTPFLNPNKPPKEIHVELDEFTDILKEYVYYGYIYTDKIDRTIMMIRDIALITDTDSTIVCMDGWLRYTLSKVFDKDIPIKNIKTNPIDFTLNDEFGKEEDLKLRKAEYIEDFDFLNDEIIKVEKAIDPVTISSSEGLRYSIINIIAYVSSVLLKDIMIKLSKKHNSYAESKDCLLVMKNEFLMKRILNTDKKKNYASNIEMQEGAFIPDTEKERLKITGLSINKSGVQKSTRDSLKKILYEDILNIENIDQIKVLKSLAILEKSIFNSIKNGEKTYYKPVSVRSITNYEDPMRIQGIKASMVWNSLKDKNSEMINLDDKNFIHIAKIDINPKNMENLIEYHKDKYDALVELMKIKEFNSGIYSIAIPYKETVPEWLLNYIDYGTIINDNICNFPLEDIGIYNANNKLNYTNIIKF